jgi:O-acetyl-ADP-ribose deacetylase (regulator of RNase III)
LAHVNHALRKLRKHIESEELTSIALPKIATGVGGLEWSDVKPLIEKNLGDLDCRVIVYTTYRAGKEASEFN